MAESFISSFAEKVLQKLATNVYQEICMGWGVKNDLKKLEDTLSTIKAVLLDAEEKQAHDHELRDWLQKLKDVCYDAEDVLEELEVESLQREVLNQRSIKRKVCHFFSSSNPLVFNFKLGNKIKKIRERLDKIADDKAKFHLTERENRIVVHTERETYSFVPVQYIIGRDEDKEKIIKLLMYPSDSGNLSVIPIVGFGGLGKTALAKLVYNDERVDRHFELKIWVCVSNDFDVKQLIVKIIKCVTGEDHGNLDVEQLQRVLRNILNGRRYLLILDDVWEDNHKKWNELKALLMGTARGSRIIVTTRSNRVASVMGTIPQYNLGRLSQESCLSLFITCAFRQGQEKQNLIKIGEEIVKKCGGVPLAVITLGALLYSETDEREWKRVRDNEIWELEQQGNDILPVLRLSYDQLPSLQKQCFACYSIFPKDHDFNSFQLIQFWMAHGLFQSPLKNEELEDIGRRYLKELWSRSFFQDFREVGGVVFLKMHDIMHDLATLVAKGECATINIGDSAQKRKNHSDQDIIKNVRHLSILDVKLLEQDVARFLGNLDSVRTISCPMQEIRPISESFLNMCISKTKCLRVLNLSDSSFEVLSRSIGAMKHLKYLNLLENKRIKKLPNSICKLCSLQTLRLDGCTELEELPRDMKYTISLRLLFIATKQKRLPENGIGCLKSLRLLGIGDFGNLEYLFEGMQHLTALRTLFIAVCPSLISLPRGMKCLTALESLNIGFCENLDLGMELEGEDNHQDHLNGFSLRALSLIGLPKLMALPQWLLQGSFNSLQHLFIIQCKNLTALPELTSLVRLYIEDCSSLISLPRGMEHLIALESLVINRCEKLNLTMEDNDQDHLSGFKLQILAIGGLPELVAMPQWLLQGSTDSLQVMRINNCPQLTSLPKEMHRFTSLRLLEIASCPALSERCKPRTGEYWPKIVHVPQIYIDGSMIKSTDN